MAGPFRNWFGHSSRRRSGQICLQLALLTWCVSGRAQESTARHVQIYWRHDSTLPITGITNVVVLDQTVCQAELVGDRLRLIGLARGKTEVFVWAGAPPEAVVVDVVEEPSKAPPPSLGTPANGAGIASLGTALQTADGSGQPGGYVFSHYLQWQENLGDDHLSVQTRWQNSTLPGNPGFTLGSGSIRYSTPSATINLLDSNLDLAGGDQARLTPYPTATAMLIRGVDAQFAYGKQRIEVFGGITPTPFFLDLHDSRAIGGLTWTRALSRRLAFYSTTAVTRVPSYYTPGGAKSQLGLFELAGATFRFSEQLKMQAGGGISTRGPIADGAFSYRGSRQTAFANATYSSLNFPLNQLRLLPSGQTSLSAGHTAAITSRLSSSLFFQHSSTQAGSLLGAASTSNYFSANTSFLLRRETNLTGGYVLTTTKGPLSLNPHSVGQRGDLALSARLTERLNNSVRTTFGTLSDPFEYNSQNSFSVSNSTNLRVKSNNTISFNAEYDQVSTGLLSRLREDIDLLSPQLQTLFLQDPAAFVRSTDLPGSIRNLLLGLTPSNVQLSASGQFLLRNRITVSPTVGYFRSTQDFHGNNNSVLLGFNVTAQVRPSLQLLSSLSNVVLLNPATGTLQRTTVFGLGLNKIVTTTPRWLESRAAKSRAIAGRVFQDLNVNGIFDLGEAGISGAMIQIDDELPVAVDSQGRFSFRDLSPGVYVVRLLLTSMRGAVRVTTPTTATLDLNRKRNGSVNFGIVNFKRIQGTLFNDYLMSRDRQPDAPGIREVRVIVSSGTFHKETVTDAGGDFGFDRLGPGDYQLTVDPSTLPPNFDRPPPSTLHVSPAQIKTEDVPLQALRSIAGVVLFKPKPGEPEQPLARVQVAVGDKSAYTDGTGAFLLRNLPAGKQTLSIIPYRSLEHGLVAPSGTINLSRDPVDGQDIRIVLTNAELAKIIVSPSSN